MVHSRKSQKNLFKSEDKEEPETWDSGLTIEEPIIVVPVGVMDILRAAENKFKKYEFSILFKSGWVGPNYMVSEEYIIPSQRVGWGTVEYLEDLTQYKERGFNTVMHFHPMSISGFSVADNDSINVHFECSILYNGGRLSDKVLNVPVHDSKVRLKPDITILRPQRDLIKLVGAKNIEVKKRKAEIFRSGRVVSNYPMDSAPIIPGLYDIPIFQLTDAEIIEIYGKKFHDSYQRGSY